ncbi:VanZ like family protein [Amycolatopsis xylanica]|uniref:VanZ like family protein n=1 Tax=Amycolatopsis xylanica TaxID=589385 RepID=A0A1H3AAU3_9PSEU|nr:VanZ family protein [Amycolatopsis xylanica]SDX26776.1 VanZ like family protein [Amycolatopsis xylanica]
MTNAQVTALTYGLLIFAAVWTTILVPQLIVHVSRYGRPQALRIAKTAMVTLYASMAVAVVLLPLPGPHSKRLEQTVQLHPFQWIEDIHTELVKHGLSAAHWFTTQTFQQAAMNVLLFVPLGLFARLMWKRGFVGTMAIGFTASLLIELTQLSANFGTAPFVYRIFDVDDLMTNTFGAMLGWVLAAMLLAFRATSTSTVHPQPVRRERVHLAQAR